MVRPPMPLGDVLSACVEVVDSDAELIWTPAEFLAEHDIQAWRDVHLWADSDSPASGSFTWSSEKALRDGLKIRSVEETIVDTLFWFKSLPEERQEKLRFGMSRERELEVLAAWQTK